jgi:hypothetical protein
MILAEEGEALDSRVEANLGVAHNCRVEGHPGRYVYTCSDSRPANNGAPPHRRPPGHCSHRARNQQSRPLLRQLLPRRQHGARRLWRPALLRPEVLLWHRLPARCLRLPPE